MVGLLKRVWRGEVDLAKVFWLGWVIPTIIISVLIDSTAYRLFLVQLVRLSPGLSMFTAYLIPLLSLSYEVLMLVAIWQSAKQYSGKRVWSVAARGISSVVVVGFITVNGYVFYVVTSLDTDDPGKDSYNITEHLGQDPSYPLVGLWKRYCADNFGLAFARAEDGSYSVSFCGPGGCFRPGTYRPNTPIYGDPNYEVVDMNTVKVRGVDGFSVYHRCR